MIIPRCKISTRYFRLYVGKVPEHAVPSVWTDKSGGRGSWTRARFGLLRADQLRASRREGDEGHRSSWPSASGRFRLQRVSGNVLRTPRAARHRRWKTLGHEAFPGDDLRCLVRIISMKLTPTPSNPPWSSFHSFPNKLITRSIRRWYFTFFF